MRTVITTIAVLVALLLLVSGGFLYSGAYYIGADQPHWSTTTWLIGQARDRSIRSHASDIAVPARLDDPGRILMGVAHYSEHCAICHGAPGVERSDVAEGLYPRPPDLADAARAYSPGELFWIIKHGVRMTGMPSWGDHSDDELWATVALIQKLPGLSGQDYAKLVAASRADGGHHRDRQQPQPDTQPAEKDHDETTGHHH